MFTYDADNRVVIADGQLVNGAIALTAGGVGITPSYENSYDAAGHVVSVESLGGTSGTDLTAQRFAIRGRNKGTEAIKQLDVSYVVTVETTAPQTVNVGFAGQLEGASGGASQVEFVGQRNLQLVGQPQPLPER